MARYTGPITKKSRRLGVDLVGGDKAYERRPYPPGEHGRGRQKESEYRTQLHEKQKARYTYGVLEKQFRRYARQLVVHGHFLVNGRKVNVPSYRVTPHDIIEVRPKSKDTTPFLIARETHGERPVPAWLEVIPGDMRILVHQLPSRQQIDTPVQEQLIVELYSK